MCGICGYICDDILENGILREMNNTMQHRGPNDNGIWEKKFSHFAVGLAHRRLSIQDLSMLGHQPMFSDEKDIAIVFNGEIYNFKDLKAELKLKNYFFKSNCDTEVILAAYREWGYECFNKFNGMFSIAIFDQRNGELILARDRIGKKPLYYYYTNKVFCFASELKPIMKFPAFKKNLRLDMIGNMLCNKYIASPDTIFEDTYKLEPGTYLIYKERKAEKAYYWNPVKEKQKSANSQIEDYDECKTRLEKLLLDSVSSRMIADVPLGSFLSGGIDSVLVTSLAQKISDRPIKTFTIGFYDKERNEAGYAKEIADYLGTDHTELYVGEKEIFDMLDELPYYFDEPFADSSQLPTMLVSQMAAKDITVALSGDGGDELFCGYKMYDWTWIAQHADWIGSILSKTIGQTKMGNCLPTELRAFIHNRNPKRKTQLFISVMEEEAEKLIGRNLGSVKFCQEDMLDYPDWQERRMMLDIMTYLPDEVLAKTDRASMKYSLEVRCPILDYRIIEESFRIPHQYKYYRFDKKHILKELAYQYIPREMLDRPKKGFGVPLKKWLRTVLASQIEMYAEQEKLNRQGIFSADAVKELIKKQQNSDKISYSSMLWSFYVFQRWYQVYIEDLWNSNNC